MMRHKPRDKIRLSSMLAACSILALGEEIANDFQNPFPKTTSLEMTHMA